MKNDIQIAVMQETDDAKKSELMRKLLDETLPNGLVKYIQRNCGLLKNICNPGSTRNPSGRKRRPVFCWK